MTFHSRNANRNASIDSGQFTIDNSREHARVKKKREKGQSLVLEHGGRLRNRLKIQEMLDAPPCFAPRRHSEDLWYLLCTALAAHAHCCVLPASSPSIRPRPCQKHAWQPLRIGSVRVSNSRALHLCPESLFEVVARRLRRSNRPPRVRQDLHAHYAASMRVSEAPDAASKGLV